MKIKTLFAVAAIAILAVVVAVGGFFALKPTSFEVITEIIDRHEGRFLAPGHDIINYEVLEASAFNTKEVAYATVRVAVYPPSAESLAVLRPLVIKEVEVMCIPAMCMAHES